MRGVSALCCPGSVRLALAIAVCMVATPGLADVCREAPKARAGATEIVRRAEVHMGTVVEISASDAACETLERAFREAFDEVARLEDLLSEWRPGTELAAVNEAAGGAAVPVGPELYALLDRSLEIAHLTRGAFDPSFASLWGLWTFGDDGVQRAPDAVEVERRRALINYRRITLDERTRSVRLEDAGMKVGLGGIAKGYATDRIAAVLRDHGLRHFTIKAGGELYVGGRPGGERARVGIRDPRGPGLFATVEAEDLAVNTSGDYERFFIDGGRRYHHIIDPATGYPATRSRSVTVLAREATLADALATAVFVLGPEEGLALVEELEGVEVVIVDRDSRVHLSSGVRGLLLRAPTRADP